MASVSKLSYQRLRNEEEILERQVKKARAWLKLRALAGRRRPRLRVAALRRFLRKRTKILSRFRVSWRMAFKKLKNGHTHVNDLFGGNFLLMQANLTPFGRGNKPYMGYGYGLRGLSTTTTYSNARTT
ncbi:uncharacterized protein LOC109800926 [Cajanus cajan]|uniref:Uncharacterized protein n=1 Tax=Cajanus cajan TaxID=3821 RepID=A0A151TEB6_CAJCA|nr:uncharacterized protein LOC109800926 [Cajanus cajan]KYP65346.1 hypothetical protein KK1_011579 [Cajanus cajan]